MSLLQSNSKVTTSTGFYDFPIGQSLRFDGSSYLSKANWPSSDGSDDYTFSAWIKISEVGYLHVIFGAVDVGSIYKQDIITITTSSELNHYQFSNANARYVDAKSTMLLRDTSAWYHIVSSYNHSGTSTVTLYVNGQSVATDGTSTTHRGINKTGWGYHLIGNYGYQSSPATNGGQFKGYIAEVNFIDGSALTPTSFAETKNGVWIPKDPSGLTYGTNGFRLTFASDTVVSNQFQDQSTNSNHWDIN